MPKESGESVYGSAVVATEETDGTGSKGDAVKLNASDQVTPTTAAGDDMYGVLAENASAKSAGDTVAVVIGGDVIANAGGGVTKGSLVTPSATAGQLASNAQGRVQAVDEGGTATYTLAQGDPKALSDSGATVRGSSLGANEAHIYIGK